MATTSLALADLYVNAVNLRVNAGGDCHVVGSGPRVRCPDTKKEYSSSINFERSGDRYYACRVNVHYTVHNSKPNWTTHLTNVSRTCKMDRVDETVEISLQ